MTKIHDSALIESVMEYIAAGNHAEVACGAVGISTGTFYTWLKIGRQVEQRIADEANAEDLRVAMLDGEQVLDLSAMECRCWVIRSLYVIAESQSDAYGVLMIRKQFPSQWLAAMTFLAQRFPTRWKRRDVDRSGEAPALGNIDEALLLADPDATHLLHEALVMTATREQKRELRKPLKRELTDAGA